MNIISVDNIIKAYSEIPLFNGTSLFVQKGEKVGVIGINGCGKSTLLKIIAGIEEPDEGQVTIANNMVISYLPQNPEFEDGDNIIESIIKLGKANMNEWEVETIGKSMLMQLGIVDFEQMTNTLSGGQKKKVALVAALVSNADIIILDEPTNHLDSDMSDWLEEQLKASKATIIMVTHDRYFLDSVTDRIVEVDKGQIYSYSTNYSGFLELKAQREDMEIASQRKRKSILRTELKWIMRGALARSTKQKARIDRYYEMKSIEDFKIDEKVEISSLSSRLGKTTIELNEVCKSYGNKQLIKDFSYIFLKDDRIGFIGKNGCGKTTLMKMIAGLIQPDSGNITIGQTVKIGYYTQEINTSNKSINGKYDITYMNPDKKIIEYITDTAQYVKTKDGTVSASAMLERFLFPPSLQYSYIGKLSGGQKRRLNLLRVLMEAPNVLIFDEPTNDLDITTLAILEDYLDSFEGIVITVSHDRYFLDRVVRRIFAFEEDGIHQYEGGYTDYSIKKIIEENKKMVESDSTRVVKSKTDDSVGNSKTGKDGRTKRLKFSYNEQREYETIADEIAVLEDKVNKLDEEYIKYSKDFVKLNEIMKEKEVILAKLDEKMDRWMYLEDLAQRIEREKND
ncbi:MAG: ABC-F family ATP-binding cassette domain-containing protein [Lachnospiraceae bacterium]|nr:ABC-F family ATP-binding cassette domain-containing protein [Lachnospiraceae bacterium]